MKKAGKVSGAAGVETMLILLIGFILFNMLYKIFSYYAVVLDVREALDAAVISAAAGNYGNDEIYRALREGNFSSLDIDEADLYDIKNNLMSDLELTDTGGGILAKKADSVVYYTIEIKTVNCENTDETLIYTAEAEVNFPVNSFGYSGSLTTPVTSQAKYNFKKD